MDAIHAAKKISPASYIYYLIAVWLGGDMSKWKTINLEQRQYELLKQLATKEGKSLGKKLGEAVDAYLGTTSDQDVDMGKVAGSVKWTNYRVALIHRWLELTMPKDVVERVQNEMKSRKKAS